MKKILLDNIKIITIAIFLSLGIGIASAWTAPTSLAPAGNVSAPINTSADSQIKQGSLWITGLNPSNLPYVNGLIVENGNVGIGTSSPASKLDVQGNVSIKGNTTINGAINVTGGITGSIAGKKAIYSVSSGCSSAGSLTTASSCTTIVCGAYGNGTSRWFTCAGQCTTNVLSSKPNACSNGLQGYLVP